MISIAIQSGEGQQIGRARYDFNRANGWAAILIPPDGPPIRAAKLKAEDCQLHNEWFWAVLLFAAPFVIFGAFEIAGLIRRRRLEAVARRPKEPRPGRPRG
jgi:hypothetical protein